MSGVFTSTNEAVYKTLILPFMQKMTDAIEFVTPYIHLSVALFITYYGYMILTGKARSPAKDFLVRIGIVSLALFIALNPDRYRTNVTEPIIKTTTVITHLVSTATNSSTGGGIFNRREIDVSERSKSIYKTNEVYFKNLDVVFASVNIFTTAIINSLQEAKTMLYEVDGKEPKTTGTGNDANTQAQDSNLNMMQMVILGVMALIIKGAVMVYVTAGSMLLLNHVFLVVLLTIGPIFIALAAYKTTRDYAKKWLNKVITIALTLALVTGMVGFVLEMQGEISGQMCSVGLHLPEMLLDKDQRDKLKPKLQEKQRELIKRFEALKGEFKIDFNSSDGTGFQQSTDKLIDRIVASCKRAASNANAGANSEKDTNLLFLAMQYMVICMIFNRLIIEMANVASAIVGSSGVNTAGSQEVSGGVGSVGGRGGLASKANTAGNVGGIPKR